MSGVYIPNMEMPSGCAECPLEMYYFNTGETRCRATNKVLEAAYRPTSYEKRDADCPLIPVPDHGRLIEAERLKEVFHRNVVCGDAFDQLIDIAPSVIPASKEVRE